MDTKFTKGEWFVNGYEIQSKNCSVELAKITVFNEGKANAHLIASAPDMYKKIEELNVLLLSLGHLVWDTIDLGAVTNDNEELLSRARGEQHD